jgi:hypothetical protein
MKKERKENLPSHTCYSGGVPLPTKVLLTKGARTHQLGLGKGQG